MGRMLDALKNLENDSGATIATPLSVALPASQSIANSSPAPAQLPAGNGPAPVAPTLPSTKPALPGGNTVGATFLATLAGTAPSNDRSPTANVPASAAAVPSSAVSSAAATLARLKANAPPVRTNSTPLPSPIAPAAPIASPPFSAIEAALPTLLPEQPSPPQLRLPPPPLPAAQSVVAPVESLAPAVPETPLPAPRSSATRLEETIKAALADPRRSVPLEQLARRMKTELRADAGRCWLLADAGEHHDSADLTAHLGAVLSSQLGDVLLIDGSLDCALLSAGLNAIDRPGLAQVASGGAKPWQSFIQPTAWQHLFLLPAGQVVSGMPDPTAAWTNLLSQAERRFRLVLVDGGSSADPSCKSLGRICDATFLVIRLGVTEARQARQAMQQLRAGGARVIGSIATSVPST